MSDISVTTQTPAPSETRKPRKPGKAFLVNGQPILGEAEGTTAPTVEEFKGFMAQIKSTHGMFSIAMKVTPEVAEFVLGLNFEHNRKVKPTRTNRYASDMIEGRWEFNPDSIDISEKCKLLNGQHRLGSCVKSGTAFPALFWFGVPTKVLPTIDSGAARTMLDAVTTTGHTLRADGYAAIRAVVAVNRSREDDGRLVKSGANMSNSEVIDWFETNEKDFSKAYDKAQKIDQTLALVRSGLIAAFFMIEQANKASPTGLAMFEEFSEKLISGVGIDSLDEPVNKVRGRIIARAVKGMQLAAEIIKAWNYTIKAESPKHVTWRKDEAFPVAVQKETVH